MKYFKLIFLFLFSTQLLSAPAIFSIGPVDDLDCDFNTVQDAIDSIIGFSVEIRISNQLTINNGIVIDNEFSIYNLQGGYANCQNAEDNIVDYMSDSYTVVSNNNGLALELRFNNSSNESISVLGFTFRDSEGVRILHGENDSELTVDIEYVDIIDNTGTGLKISHGDVVVNVNHVKISQNGTNMIYGGGIFCIDAELNIGEDTAINNNLAGWGGGIFAQSCLIDLSAGDNNPIESLEYGIFNNSSKFNGAGINLNKSILIGNGTNLHPISITNNNIIEGSGNLTYGGGIYMNSGSIVFLKNLRLDANSSRFYGGAIAAVHSDINISDPYFVITKDDQGCSYNDICSTISFNQVTTNLLNTGGAAIYMQGSGTGYVEHTKLDGNSVNGTNVFKVIGGGSLNLNSDLIVNNTAMANLMEQEDNSFVGINYSTLADNQVSNYFNVLYDNNNPQTLEVIGTIIKNGQATIANLNNDGGNHDAQVKCSLVENNDSTGVVQDLSIVGEPGFAGQSNYKLSPNSQAINSGCTNIQNDSTFRFDVRGYDRNTEVIAGTATVDLGAYEYIDADDVIFRDGLE